jgi:predicted DNA-binding transcriptional regulator
MTEIFLAILMGLWAYAWYKLGYVQAQINETQKRIREINRDTEKRIDEIQKSLKECSQALKEMD